MFTFFFISVCISYDNGVWKKEPNLIIIMSLLLVVTVEVITSVLNVHFSRVSDTKTNW